MLELIRSPPCSGLPPYPLLRGAAGAACPTRASACPAPLACAGRAVPASSPVPRPKDPLIPNSRNTAASMPSFASALAISADKRNHPHAIAPFKLDSGQASSCLLYGSKDQKLVP